MNRHNIPKVIYWTPRVISILFALFISLFALDVFNEGYTIGEAIMALLIHLVPTYIVIILLIFAWKWEWIGAVAFFGLGAYYIAATQLRFPPVTYLAISGPLFLLSIFFILNCFWRYKGQHKDE